ncbi:hypothetical protein ACFL6S_07920 [Candidatus Poribacteria bacterium]
MGSIATFLKSMPWGSVDNVLLIMVSLLLILVSWRLYGATNRYVEAAKNMAEIGEAQEVVIREQIGATEKYVKEIQDLINLERLKFLDQLEFFYKNKPDEIKPRFGLDNPQAEDRFLSGLIQSRVTLSIKVFDDIVRDSMSREKYRG